MSPGLKESAPSILILTGSFGHGHNTAAKNLAEGFRRARPDAPVEVLDFFEDGFPRLNAVLRKGYDFAINRAPFVWRQLYGLANGQGRGCLPLTPGAKYLRAAVDRRAPDVVVTTFPFVPLLLSRSYPDKTTQPFPLFTIVTDAITINAIWCQGRTDRFFVTDSWSADVVMRMGIDDERIRAYGFPLSSFERGDGVRGQDPPRILYLPTTKSAHVDATLRALVPWCQAQGARLTLVLGSHVERLEALVKDRVASLDPERCTIHGWRKDVPSLMCQHDTVITKAGGATVSEALGAMCPPILNYVVPGQEEGNAELVKRSACGLRIMKPHELPSALDRLLMNDGGALRKTFRERLSRLERDQATERIVAEVLSYAHDSTSRSG